MKINILKLLCILLLFLSCKNSNTNHIDNPPKKKNILERTKWKSSAIDHLDNDVVLDFYTNKDVQEYVINNKGEQKKSRVGTYKVKSKRILKIRWGHLSVEAVDGIITERSMRLTEGVLNSRTYYKLSSY